MVLARMGARQQPKSGMSATAHLGQAHQFGPIGGSELALQLDGLDGRFVVQYGVHLVDHDGDHKQSEEGGLEQQEDTV